MYNLPEINSFDQHIWREERQKLYNQVKEFCYNNNIDFTLEISEDYIKKSKHDRIVFMVLFDIIPEFIQCHNINQQCQQYSKQVYIITDNILNVVDFEFIKFFSYPKLLGITASYTDPINLTIPTKLYNCFIQRSDPIRQSWFYLLHHHQLLDRGYVSFLLNQLADYTKLTGLELFKYIHYENGLDQLSAFEESYQQLKNCVPYCNFTEEQNLLPLITNSKYSLVLETDVMDDNNPVWFFTEKTMRTLQFPSIPLLFVKQQSIAILKNLGFEMGIDLDYIDQLPWQQRQQELLAVLINDSVDFIPSVLYNQSMHNRELLQSWKIEYQRVDFFDEVYSQVLEK